MSERVKLLRKIEEKTFKLPYIITSANTKVGYNKEIVTPQCGYIIDDGSDLGGWSEAILELAKDWNHYLQMSKEAMLRYEHKFSYEQNLKFWTHLCKL